MVLKYRFACFRADLILRCPFDWFYADLRWTGARFTSQIDILKANELKQTNWAVWSLSKDSSFNRQLLKRSRYFWRVGTIRYIKQSKYQRTTQRISEVEGLYMPIFTKKLPLFCERIIKLPNVFRCIYRCQKWIPDKILHRNNNSIFFSTIFFSTKKKTFWKWKKKFGNFSFFLENHFFFQRKNLIFLQWFSKILKILKFPRNFLFLFSKWKFLSKKNELRKKSNYHFDVKFCQESIFCIDKCNGTRWEALLCAHKKVVIFL